MIKTGKEVYFIYCPYCGEELKLENISAESNDAGFFTCTNPKCNKELKYEVEWRPTFTVEKADRGLCLECGCETSFTTQPSKKVLKYESIPNEQYCLCSKCQTKLQAEEVTAKTGFSFTPRKRK